MKRPLIYVTTNTAGITPEEVKNKIDSIVYNLKLIGVDESQIFRTDSIDPSLTFEEEINIRMSELAKADVLILDYERHTWIQGQIELKEANRLCKPIRVNRMGDYDDIRKKFVEG